MKNSWRGCRFGAVFVAVLFSSTLSAQESAFDVIAELDAGRAPHQIAFNASGTTAYIAAAGSDEITFVNVATRTVVRRIPSSKTPLGVVPITSDELLVSRFRGNTLAQMSVSGMVSSELHVGDGPSILVGPLPGEAYLVSIEREDRLRVVATNPLRVTRSYPTGARPFPASFTSDGRLAFVPNYDDGTVSVIDLENDRVRDIVTVGNRPSGGTVVPGGLEYSVAIRGENRLAFIHTATFEVTGVIEEGIGDGPFSVVASAEHGLLFANNTESHTVSVVDIESKRVVETVAVGELPIAMAVHPSSDTLWVASEGAHTVSIVRLPIPVK